MDRISGWVRLWLLGLLAQRPGWDGVVCATHGALTHWIEVSADEAVSCRSATTLHLCRAMNGADRADEDAVSATISHPERLSTDLRSAQLIKDGSAVTGHLVGAELAAMRPYWLGREVVLVSDQPGLYSTAIQAQGVPVMSYSPEELLRTGLTAIERAHGLGD
ncbi:MAG: 2-dehydro-3-deoxygalactonokinase [Pseudomonadota bacterium]